MSIQMRNKGIHLRYYPNGGTCQVRIMLVRESPNEKKAFFSLGGFEKLLHRYDTSEEVKTRKNVLQDSQECFSL